MTEMEDPRYPYDPSYPLWQSVNSYKWWLLDGTGQRIAGHPGSYMINSTGWTRTDSSGDRFPQARAKADTANLLSKLNGIDYVYFDGVVPFPTLDCRLQEQRHARHRRTIRR